MVALTLIFITGCTDDFTDINTDPNGITDESLTQMNNNIANEFQPMFLNVFNVTPAWNYQLQQNLMGDVYSGYMTPPTPFAGNVNNMTYALVDGWNGFPWSDAYGSVMPQALNVLNAIELSGDESGLKFVYLANIIKVTAMHRVSDIYGPIRHTKYNDFATTGEYDAQDVAYQAFFDDLGAAIDGLEVFEGEGQFTPFDMSNLAGDIALWRQFANSMRLRLAVRIVKLNPALAKAQGDLADFLENKIPLYEAAIFNFKQSLKLKEDSDTYCCLGNKQLQLANLLPDEPGKKLKKQALENLEKSAKIGLKE